MTIKMHIFRTISCMLVLFLLMPDLKAQKPSTFDLNIMETKALTLIQEKNNVEFQIIGLKGILDKDSCSVVVFAEGNDPYRVQFKKGENSLEIPAWGTVVLRVE